MSPRELVVGLARSIREAVAPALGTGRDVTGITPSGDTVFALDLLAEAATEGYLRRLGVDVALFSEEGGLVGNTGAPWLLVVDPIDGTRPAKAGLETCCVSVGLAPNRPSATLGDVTHAAVYELGADRLFVAERGEGTVILEPGLERQPTPSTREELVGAALSFEVVGRPAVPTMTVLADILDDNSLAGGAFTFASTTYSLTRLVTGQLDLHLDVSDRIWRERPELHPAFLRAGLGHMVALCTYDLAGVALVAREAGVALSDAYGESLDTMGLIDVSYEGRRSCVAAGNASLHARALEAVDQGMKRLG